MPLDDKVRKALDTIFSGDAGLYQTRGWNQRSGFGTRPALLNIDLANAWTRPGYRFSCDDMDERIIPGVQRLLSRRPCQEGADHLHHHRLLQPLRHGRLPA